MPTSIRATRKWRAIDVAGLGHLHLARRVSTYVANPPYFEGMTMTPAPVADIIEAQAARDPGRFDHHRPHLPGRHIKADSPAGTFLQEHQVSRADFNSYGARRGNHEVMMRGTFANIRIKNEMVPGVEGGMTQLRRRDHADLRRGDAATRPTARRWSIIAGKEYGTGSSRDWAAKGTNLLGVRAVITESFERIHRSNLVGMGVLPLQFADGVDAPDARLDGDETFTITQRRRAPPAPGRRGRSSPAPTARVETFTDPLPDRYRQRAGIFPQRRHPAVRAAEAGGVASAPLPLAGGDYAANARRRA